MKKLIPFALLLGLCLAPLGCTDMEDVADENAEARAAKADAMADGVMTDDEADDVEDEMDDAAAVNEELMEGDVMDGTGIPGDEFDGDDVGPAEGDELIDGDGVLGADS